jgi:hypothetical protein
VEDNPADKSASDMAVMLYNTATIGSGCSMKNTVNVAQQFAADEMKDEDEEPPEEHDDQDRDKLFKKVTEVPAPIQKAMEEQNLVEDNRTN